MINNININNNFNNNNNNDNDNDSDNDNQEEKQNQIFHKNFIQELKSNKFIYIKDYPEQEINEKNINYINWLQNIYTKIYLFKEKNLPNKLINNKGIFADYYKLNLELKNNLYFCTYPKCKSIIYMSDKQKDKFKKIQNLFLKDFNYEYRDIFYFEKIRCTLCLKYKCKYCNKISTCKFNYCCFYQAFKACYESKDIDIHNCLINFAICTPFVRIWYYGFMFSYPFYRLLTRPKKFVTR